MWIGILLACALAPDGKVPPPGGSVDTDSGGDGTAGDTGAAPLDLGGAAAALVQPTEGGWLGLANALASETVGGARGTWITGYVFQQGSYIAEMPREGAADIVATAVASTDLDVAVLADLDGDGVDDLVGAEWSSEPDPEYPEVALQRADWYVVPGPLVGRLSSGDAAAHLAGEASSVTEAWAVGDVTGDDRDDVLLLLGTGEYGDYETRFLPASGEAGWADAELLTEGRFEGVDALGLGDVDGDGRDDLALLYEDGWRVFAGPLAGPVEATDALASCPADVTAVQAGGDIDGDGHADLLLSVGRDELRVIAGPVGPGLAEAAAVATIAGSLYFDSVARGGDADGDGRDDVLLANVGVPHVWWFPGPLSGASTGGDAGWTHEPSFLRDGFGFAPDVDGDGRQGILVPDGLWSGIAPEAGAILLFEVP